MIGRLQVCVPMSEECYRQVIDSGLLGSTDFHSSHPQGHEPEVMHVL